MTADRAPPHRTADLVVRYGDVPPWTVSASMSAAANCHAARPLGLRQDHDVALRRRLEKPTGGAIRIERRAVYSAAERRNVPAEKRGVPWCSSPMRSGRT